MVEHNSVETHHAVEPLAVEWEALAARTGATPFVHPGWMAAWYSAFGRGRPLVAALRRDGELAAVAALETHRGTLRSATNWHTPEYDVVADSPEAARALADAVIAPPASASRAALPRQRRARRCRRSALLQRARATDC